ncbi:TetR/AcrR family transcriptional regulator [Meridianimarinicoccus aquatilis]|uniref:TetR family transcriptional regulator n=1 Tax=Meridianimarinicoccus aquatilis TaxID=2552766 RepID=A0A4R6B567_9RHOB|nr:TetR/AcrR family transcriptional regulator [Fluviibacterium aquatile]QIE40571.1 TetR family transcriptional regulator [Rhodobacteraceae bacterium SC52]TDL91078.1 TetR family transcriptional regulator [Fluviibacterium aquatile]
MAAEGSMPNVRKKRDAASTRAAILQAALDEFSEMGHGGARVDRIASRAGVSKPMIYDYFGGRDAVYAAALREAILRNRHQEAAFDADLDDPHAALRALVVFLMDHFRQNPWFMRMLSAENLLGAETILQMGDDIGGASILVTRLGEILQRGVDQGAFRDDVTPVEAYVFIVSLCCFPVSNMHTLRAAFGAQIDEAWLKQHADRSAEMFLCFLKSELS